MKWLSVICVVCAFTLVHAAEAAPALDPYTQDHIFILPHAKPAWFSATAFGFEGETEDGTLFSQAQVETESSVRLQKFTIGSASYYISNRGIITADSDIAALSIYLTLT